MAFALTSCAAPPREDPLRPLLALPAASPPSERAFEARGFLGLRLGEAASGGLDEMADETGLPVELVTPNGPAEAAGVRPGDRVLALGGDPVRFRDAFENREALLEPGRRVELTLARGPEVHRLALEVERRRAARPPPPPAAIVERRLAAASLRTPDAARARALRLRPGLGVEIVALSAESPWRDAGLRPGDVVLAAGGATLHAPRELVAALERAGPGGEVALEVARGPAPGRTFRTDAPLRAPPRVRDLNLLYLFRYERDDPKTDVSALFYFFRWRSSPKETRVNILWFLSFAWAGDESLTEVE